MPTPKPRLGIDATTVQTGELRGVDAFNADPPGHLVIRPGRNASTSTNAEIILSRRSWDENDQIYKIHAGADGIGPHAYFEWYAGNLATPEGAITAPRGSVYMSSSGAFFVKTTDGGTNTGWIDTVVGIVEPLDVTLTAGNTTGNLDIILSDNTPGNAVRGEGGAGVAGDAQFIGGTATAGVADGGTVRVFSGDGFGDPSKVSGDVQIASGESGDPGTTTPGVVVIQGTHATSVNPVARFSSTDATGQFSVVVTDGSVADLHVGTIADPNGSITANAGAMYVQADLTGPGAGALWVKTIGIGTNTDWALANATETWAETLVAGNISGGTEVIISGTDRIVGEDTAGPLRIEGGDTGVNPDDGYIQITAGPAVGAIESGRVEIATQDGGAGTSGFGAGRIQLVGGDGGAGTTGSGGSGGYVIGQGGIGGASDTGPGGDGGSVQWSGGSGGSVTTFGNGGDGGYLDLSGGGGGTGIGAGSLGGDGGDVSIQGGGSGTGVWQGGDGGTINIAGGPSNGINADGGPVNIIAGSSNDSAAGANVNISAGDGGAIAGKGGDIFLNAGTGFGGSPQGEVISTSVFSADNIKRGIGDPNGVVSGNIGDWYQRTDAGESYVNTDGTNTGWLKVGLGEGGFLDGFTQTHFSYLAVNGFPILDIFDETGFWKDAVTYEISGLGTKTALAGAYAIGPHLRFLTGNLSGDTSGFRTVNALNFRRNNNFRIVFKFRLETTNTTDRIFLGCTSAGLPVSTMMTTIPSGVGPPLDYFGLMKLEGSNLFQLVSSTGAARYGSSTIASSTSTHYLIIDATDNAPPDAVSMRLLDENFDLVLSYAPPNATAIVAPGTDLAVFGGAAAFAATTPAGFSIGFVSCVLQADKLASIGGGGGGGFGVQNLATTLGVGNETGANDIVITSGQIINGKDDTVGAIFIARGGHGSAGDGGDAVVLGGDSLAAGGDGGDVGFVGGVPDPGGNGWGGSVFLVGEDAAGLGWGGSIAFQAGSGPGLGGGVGGSIIGAAGLVGDTGGIVGFVAGDSTGIGNPGGDVTFAAGDAGDADGGWVYISAGDATAGNNDGGDIDLTPGAGFGSGNPGVVRVNGKLTVTGIIDPTGLVLTGEGTGTPPVPSVASDEGVIWVDDTVSPTVLKFTNSSYVTITLGAGGGGGDLQTTLGLGDFTGANNIVVSKTSPDGITGEDDATGDGGPLVLRGGNSTNAGSNGGLVQLLGGLPGTGGNGGNIVIQTPNTGSAGDINIATGDGTTDPGNISISAGDGGAVASVSGGVIKLAAGDGSSPGVGIAGAGGSVEIYGGQGGSGTTGANGGSITLTAGDASPNGDGGDITLNPGGDGGGTGSDGTVIVNGKLTVSGIIDPLGMVFDNQVGTPLGTPSAGKSTLWVRTDKKLVMTDDTGTDTVFGAGGGIPGAAASFAEAMTLSQTGYLWAADTYEGPEVNGLFRGWSSFLDAPNPGDATLTATAVDGEGTAILMTTGGGGGNGKAGFSTVDTVHRRDQRFLFACKFQVPSGASANHRFFIGLTTNAADTQVSSESPAGNYIGLQSRNANTNFEFVSRGISSAINTAIALDTNVHYLVIDATDTGQVVIRLLQADGVTEDASHTETVANNLPTPATGMRAYVGGMSTAGTYRTLLGYYAAIVTRADILQGVGSGADLATVLGNGNDTNGNNILISATDEIIGQSGGGPGGGIIIRGGASTGGGGNGGTIELYGGLPNGVGTGGSVDFIAADSAGGSGGGINMFTGAGGVGSGGDLTILTQSGITRGGNIDITLGPGSTGPGGGFSLLLGDGTSGGDFTVQTGQGSSVSGGEFQLVCGAGIPNGGGFIFQGGAGANYGGGFEIYTGNGTANAGGVIQIVSGNGTSGGDWSVALGDGSAGYGGSFQLATGQGTSGGGQISLVTGGGLPGAPGGPIQIVCGDGDTSGPGGSLILASGRGVTNASGNAGAGGQMSIAANRGGTTTNPGSNAGDGGNLQIAAGLGGDADSGTAGLGGSLAIQAGAGGNNTTLGDGQVGGNIQMGTGAGGDGAGASKNGAQGGDFQITLGDGGEGTGGGIDGVGGSFVLQAGSGGSVAGTSGAGGNISLVSGTGGSGGHGIIVLSTPAPVPAILGAGGEIRLTTTNSGTNQGSVLRMTSASGALGGGIQLTSGLTTTTTAGNINLAAGGATTGTGGSVNISGGVASGAGTGGNVVLTPGTGGSSNGEIRIDGAIAQTGLGLQHGTSPPIIGLPPGPGPLGFSFVVPILPGLPAAPRTIVCTLTDVGPAHPGGSISFYTHSKLPLSFIIEFDPLGPGPTPTMAVDWVAYL